MTNIEQKALAMVYGQAGAGKSSLTRNCNAWVEALCRAIEQHEAFRQEVSDAIQAMLAKDGAIIRNYLDRFIIPAPKPDPLVAMAESMGYYGNDAEDLAEEIRAGLDALGFEIREKNDDQNFNTCNRMR